MSFGTRVANANTQEHIPTHRHNGSWDTINWAYPSHYRPQGPTQSVPRAAHTPSTSISSNNTSHCLGHKRSRSDMSTTLGKGVDAQEVIARILQRDAIPQGSYMASQKKGGGEGVQERKYPERIDSRRALLSMAGGIKAPLLLRGPSHSSKAVKARKVPEPVLPPVPKRTSTIQYLHKELPPTPPSSNSNHSAHSPPATTPHQTNVSTAIPVRKTGLPTTRPLNLGIAGNTLAAKRLSRAKGKVNGGSFALSRFRAIPAPIQLPRVRGPSAFNGPSSACTTDEEFAGDGDIEELQLGEPLISRRQEQVQQLAEREKPKVVVTPMGDLPITPLDIPVDWDDLHERWTSPVAIHPEPEKSASGDAIVFDAFRQDINDLFARSPSIEVRGSIEAGFSAENEGISRDASRALGHAPAALHPFSCAADLSSSDSDGGVKEKRHGKVLVKKELKLCLDMNVDFGEEKKRRNSKYKSRGYKAGESFLMMTSPLSPETASLRASIVC